MECWGGLECTVARIGDAYRDQVRETGHRDRMADLDLVAGLGIRTLRYPIVWETIAPERDGPSDFSWHDERLGRLRELGIAPIAGLVHHGSGPSYTDLLDPDFPRLAARHAARAARRYPWITRWTPVNEPLTTARFSCLYGHWYPHRRDEHAFLRALVNQCRAVLLSMRAIRRVVPAAELVQTEDLGRVFSTPALAYQAEYENERRWLSFDLLFGRVDRDHPWWQRFRDAGIGRRELDELGRGEGRPDIVGINHYLTTDRYLDERTDLYPAHLAGGNAYGAYADAEAVRIPALDPAELGPGARLREAWERYGTPLVLSEVHHGSSRDEQVRWLSEVWREAEAVRRDGVDVRAATAWSLFGTVDWNSLLTRDIGLYEPGAFDARGSFPRPTALANAIAAIAAEGRFDHPVLDVPGWWRRDSRFYAGLAVTAAATAEPERARSLLVCGPDTAFQRALLHIAAARGLRVVLRRGASPVEAVGLEGIWAVVATPDTDDEADAAEAGRLAVASLAAACRADGVPLLAFTAGSAAAVEDERLRELCPGALVVVTQSCFGPWDRSGAVVDILGALASGRPCGAEGDVLAPAYLPDLAHVALDLFLDGERGIRHLANDVVTRGELVRLIEERTGLRALRAPGGPPGLAEPPGPPGAGRLMPPLASALDRFLADCGFDWRAGPETFRVAAE